MTACLTCPVLKVPKSIRIAYSAELSEDRTRRLILRRVWGPEPPLLFIVLNPSTANEREDDPTIRKLIHFARTWDKPMHGGLVACNLYTTITPYPERLPKDAPAGDDEVLLREASKAGRILAAWGAFPQAKGRDAEVLGLLGGYDVWCVGLTKDGSPRHPLYLPNDTKPLLWHMRRATA